MKDIVDLMLQVNVGAYQFEAANPRHEHEWVVWRSVKLPPGKVLIPGVISHATNIVEHPELVAQRIVRLADIVGRENVMGGTDCGFAQVAVCAARSSHHHVGEAQVPRRRRKNCDAGTVGTSFGGVTLARSCGGTPMRTGRSGTSNRRSFLLSGATLAGAAMAPAFAAQSRESSSMVQLAQASGTPVPHRHRRSTVKVGRTAGGKRQQLRLRGQGGPVDLPQRARGV